MIDLMSRKNDGIEVTLYWDRDERFEVRVKSHNEAFILPATAENCTEVFNHPYIYREPSFVPTVQDQPYYVDGFGWMDDPDEPNGALA